jgi:hypothetical protein
MKADHKNYPGEPFNPWREACGFYPPEVVGRHKSFGDGPKRLYEYLVRRIGRKCYCWPSKKTMGLALGKSERQIRNDLSLLRKAGLGVGAVESAPQRKR